MKALFLASGLVFVRQASAYDILYTVQVDCHAGPGRAYKLVKTYLLGEDVELKCQVHGETIRGNDVWGLTPDNCYVPDFYIRTGYSGMVKGTCNSGNNSSTARPVTSKSASAKSSHTSKTTSAKSSPTSNPSAELERAGDDAGESDSSAPKMTKIAHFSSEEPSSVPESAASSKKPNGAGSLAVPSGNMLAIGAAVVYMLNLI